MEITKLKISLSKLFQSATTIHKNIFSSLPQRKSQTNFNGGVFLKENKEIAELIKQKLANKRRNLSCSKFGKKRKNLFKNSDTLEKDQQIQKMQVEQSLLEEKINLVNNHIKIKQISEKSDHQPHQHKWKSLFSQEVILERQLDLHRKHQGQSIANPYRNRISNQFLKNGKSENLLKRNRLFFNNFLHLKSKEVSQNKQSHINHNHLMTSKAQLYTSRYTSRQNTPKTNQFDRKTHMKSKTSLENYKISEAHRQEKDDYLIEPW